MAYRNTDRFSLAVHAVNAAFTLIARHTALPGTLEIIEIDGGLRALRHGDQDLLRQTLQALSVLAASPRLFGIRLLAMALAQSLPLACSVRVTSSDIHNAALDLMQLANEAEGLCAPDIAIELAGIVDAMVEPQSAGSHWTTNDGLH